MTTLTKVREIASCHREASEGFARWRGELHSAIRKARHEGATLGQLAQATGYTRQRISQITKGGV